MKRSGLILVAVVLAAIAVAGMVATRSQGTGSTAMSTYGSGGGDVGFAADSSGAATADAVDAALNDPAKDKPILDKFHSKDPFTPHFVVAVGGGTSGTGTTTNPTPTATATPLAPVAADVKVNATLYKNQKKSAKLPPGASAVFQVSKVTSSGVVFKLINGWELPDFKTTLTIAEGETQDPVTVVKGAQTKDFAITVVRIIYQASGGGGGGGGLLGGSSVTQGAHSIKVLSIDSQNGTASATLVVDGVTYANKQVGDTFSTGWGQIKVLGINAAAQTVTVLQGDQRITLQVGQSYAK